MAGNGLLEGTNPRLEHGFNYSTAAVSVPFTDWNTPRLYDGHDRELPRGELYFEDGHGITFPVLPRAYIYESWFPGHRSPPKIEVLDAHGVPVASTPQVRSVSAQGTGFVAAPTPQRPLRIATPEDKPAPLGVAAPLHPQTVMVRCALCRRETPHTTIREKGRLEPVIETHPVCSCFKDFVEAARERDAVTDRASSATPPDAPEGPRSATVRSYLRLVAPPEDTA